MRIRLASVLVNSTISLWVCGSGALSGVVVRCRISMMIILFHSSVLLTDCGNVTFPRFRRRLLWVVCSNEFRFQFFREEIKEWSRGLRSCEEFSMFRFVLLRFVYFLFRLFLCEYFIF